MATLKTGLDYFPFDINFFNIDTVQLIGAKFGLKGENILLRLMCKIFNNGYFCRFGSDEILLFTKQIGDGCEYSFVKKVMNEALERGFFDKGIHGNFSIITSYEIQKIYFNAATRRKYVEAHKPLLLMNASEIPNVYILDENECIISSNGDIFPQRRGEERRGEKRESEQVHSLAKESDFKTDLSAPVTDYDRFLSWMKENAPYCAAIGNFSHQISEKEFARLKEKYTGKEIANIIEELENRKDHRKKYTNLYRTVLNWAEREYGK